MYVLLLELEQARDKSGRLVECKLQNNPLY